MTRKPIRGADLKRARDRDTDLWHLAKHAALEVLADSDNAINVIYDLLCDVDDDEGVRRLKDRRCARARQKRASP